MHQDSITGPDDIRRAPASALATALIDSRRDTLATFEVYERGLRALEVPMHSQLNPPLWELGHIGWFQEYWIGRNPQRSSGANANPDAARGQPLRAQADALYNSSNVAHDTRWHLALPDAQDTRADLAQQLEQTIELLQQAGQAAGDADHNLYFFRLALMHEDMHQEAERYMAQALGLSLAGLGPEPSTLPQPAAQLAFDGAIHRLGYEGEGFAFDNELTAHDVRLAPFAIDAQPVRWAEYLPFVDDGGYRDSRWWDADGAAWLASLPGHEAPRYLRQEADGWSQCRHGAWQALDMNQAASHLSWFEARAWCRWAGRRLPSEAEWEHAAQAAPQQFRWGDAWDWTDDAFTPYPGFRAHPYRDYSAPWFHTRKVLRGASFMTQPRLRDTRYRNYFEPVRNDIAAGFRSCALQS